jgi:hypothetical protein
MCFVWIWEQTAIISPYSINWLVFITEKECVYCAVRSAHTVYLWVLCVSENKQRLFHCTALTDWFFLTERKCVYCAVRSAISVYLWVLCVSENKHRLFHCTALTEWFL